MTFDLDDIAGLQLEDLIDESPYEYNGKFVPRVTHILSKMIEEPGIRQWANSLGFKHKSYTEQLKIFADLGSRAHNSMEKIANKDFKNGQIEYDLEPVQAFCIWWNQLVNAGVKVLGTEKKLVNDLYGGTYDLLMKVNNKIWLVDYKTSNYITYKYFLQLAAYRKILREEYNINLDGCLILQLSKYSVAYREWIIDLHNINHYNYMDICERTFLSLAYGYYHTIYLEKVFQNEWGKAISDYKISEEIRPAVLTTTSS